ncbi:hypothetical protein CEXT_60731 [Caerostris extrusa]|uniref:Uncharacterized protein n=1 Tax=Caerostris extrusa TaxID=172846 RepID=A0AAV4XDM5_CAEEX|nr:hypothetical protein CEXT_60731 [Caerostris extrusa]
MLSGFFFSYGVNPNCVGDAESKECNRVDSWNKTELISQIKEQQNEAKKTHDATCFYAHHFANQFSGRSPTSLHG